MSGEAFVKEQDAEGFDLDAWISGAKLPTRTATVYGRADLLGEYEELEQTLSDARAAREKRDGAGDDRLTGRSDEQRIAEQMDAIRDTLMASKLLFKFRALLDAEVEQTRKDAGKGASPDEITYRLLTVQVIHPEVPWEKWAKIRQGIGEGQFNQMLEVAAAATQDKRVSVPFSLAASVALNTQD